MKQQQWQLLNSEFQTKFEIFCSGPVVYGKVTMDSQNNDGESPEVTCAIYYRYTLVSSVLNPKRVRFDFKLTIVPRLNKSKSS